ncbi:MAG: hypothetical protein K9N52_06675, partial [Verrucomicrobia bacterium]|nr:hypothetical protein [Verrucomicrobiota bacterium]
MRIHKRIHIGILLCVGVAIACTAQAQSEKNKDQQREQVLRELLDRAYKGETAVSPDSSATNIMTKEEYLRALKQKEASAANADIKQTAAATNQLPAQPIESDTANSGGQAQSAFPTFPMPQNADQQNTTPPSELQQDQATSAQSPTQTADQPSTTNALPVPQVQQSPQQPRTPTKSEETRTINFPDMPLEQFLDFYAELTGKTILRPMNLPNVTITLKSQTPLTTKEAIQACDSVLALNNITMIPTGDKFITAVPSAQALKEAAAFSEIDPEELPETDQFVTKIVQLKHTEPSEIMSSLQPFANMPNGLVPIESSQVIVLRDYAPN